VRPAIATTYTNVRSGCFEQRFYHSTPYNVCFIKTTYRVDKSGALKLLLPQPSIMFNDLLELKDREYCSIRTPSDFVPYKDLTDVTVVGHAQSSQGKGAQRWLSTLHINAERVQTKQLLVSGTREWKHRTLKGWQLSEPLAVDRVLLAWEHAYGGMRIESNVRKKKEIFTSNPIGVGFDDFWRLDSKQSYRACQLEYTDSMLAEIDVPIKPAGVGPLPPYFEDRLQYAGTPENQPHNSMPTDMNLLYWSAAPKDQRVEGYLNGGEDISLDGFFADGKVTIQIPRWNCQAISTNDKGEKASHPMNLDTVHIDLDVRHVSFRWSVLVPYILDDQVVEEIELLGLEKSAAGGKRG
jgi:hypothetical protein